MDPRTATFLKFGGACFGLGALAADLVGPLAALAGLVALAAGFILPRISSRS